MSATEASRERANERNRRYWTARREEILARKRRRYAANPENVRESRRRWLAANPEKVRESKRRRYAANPEKEAERHRRYRAANPEKIRERERRWRAANPEKIRENRETYREQALGHDRRRLAAAQARTTDNARRRGYVWTGPELEIAARDDLTVAEIARMLGRTYYAVVTARHRIRRDPRADWLAGLARPRRE